MTFSFTLSFANEIDKSKMTVFSIFNPLRKEYNRVFQKKGCTLGQKTCCHIENRHDIVRQLQTNREGLDENPSHKLFLI